MEKLAAIVIANCNAFFSEIFVCLYPVFVRLLQKLFQNGIGFKTFVRAILII